MNKSSSNQNGGMISHETAEEMRAKFIKHQQIYKANYEQAEIEIKRMDEVYQDLIENVLKVNNLDWFTSIFSAYLSSSQQMVLVRMQTSVF